MTSASVDTTQVPKIVHIATEKLEEADLPVTGQNLFECLSKNEWEALSWVFRFYLCKDQEKLLMFKKTKTDEECREMVAQFVLDPSGKNELKTQADPLELAKLLQESGRWHGWNLQNAGATAVEAATMEVIAAMMPPRKMQKLSQKEWRSRLWKKKTMFQNALRRELKLYAEETMNLFNTNLEAFVVCAAEGQKLYAWMAELLKTDPDCLDELEAIECELENMTWLVDAAMYEGRKGVLADMKRLGGK